MKLKGHALGLSLGVVWGGTVFLATIILKVKQALNIHYDSIVGVGPTLEKLGQFYMGYSVTWWGAIVGLVYGFVHAYIVALIIVWIYNHFAKES